MGTRPDTVAGRFTLYSRNCASRVVEPHQLSRIPCRIPGDLVDCLGRNACSRCAGVVQHPVDGIQPVELVRAHIASLWPRNLHRMLSKLLRTLYAGQRRPCGVMAVGGACGRRIEASLPCHRRIRYLGYVRGVFQAGGTHRPCLLMVAVVSCEGTSSSCWSGGWLRGWRLRSGPVLAHVCPIHSGGRANGRNALATVWCMVAA
jgi:hypothetical protein